MIFGTKINFDGIAERVERLKEIPLRVEGIELIVLFGSLANGQPCPLSDVDVAFQVSNLDAKKRIRIWEETTDALETEEVDIVYLNDDIPYRLKYNIAWDGQLLYEGRQGAFLQFQVDAAMMWMDFKPLADWQNRLFLERVKKEGFGR
ncbi:nucleotidyltransferase domain-containing protein [Candidatus Sumerlaeota bacterium]|nr:nucleotidyltransferase domain-containing protein [Candidatus Sumerlaeota bacterium]